MRVPSNLAQNLLKPLIFRFCSKFQVTKESEAMTRSLAEARITPRARRVGRRRMPA